MDISLLLWAQARVATFLAELPAAQILALAEGRATLALLDVAGDKASPRTVPTPPAAPSATVPPSAAVPPPATVPSPAAVPPPSATPPVAVPHARTRAAKDPQFDAYAVAAQLRSCATVDEATERLAAFNLKATELKEVARALNVPVNGRKDEIAKRILTLTVGARSKHAGLRRG